MLTTRMEYQLSCSAEASDGTSTHRWVKNGAGNGQEAFYKEQKKWPDAEIVISIREVVETAWVRRPPDEPCSGSGYTHPAHGKCEGYTTDRT